MMQLIKTPYDLRSGYPIVRRTLEDKKKLVRKEGFGPYSCCATVEYKMRGNSRYSFGNSQMRLPVLDDIYTNNFVRLHGEMAAVVIAIERAERYESDKLPAITSLYVELHPCMVRCMPALQNILSDNVNIYYSFDHPDEVEEWKQCAGRLCNT
ncbi:hypothetical protein [Pluralibacter gergoviae]|uniref:hypothetical protein n=1 Tax=Pluralibacter gergoviae TaxID=61647 RepID=UPI0006AC6828|nr:hypothetical protein [Pluralibacter gergoviae]KOQ92062.1 hypothetical protein ABW48_20895 [Pluralibacter gergoviae]MDU4004618.1 hypothetical protein [Pluralibacter gergoviae]